MAYQLHAGSLALRRLKSLLSVSLPEIGIDRALVRVGFALAKRDESNDDVPAVDAAKAEGIGIWQGRFTLPADFRVQNGHFVDRP